MGYSLGIDLGTTFVAAAIAHPKQIDMVTLGDRTVVTPSVVYRRQDGVIVTGEAASRRAVSNPDRVGREFKRRIGDPTPVMLGGAPFEVADLLAAVLRDVLTRITRTEGAQPEQVVLTHPANWGPFRRGLFEKVPILAGLEDVLLTTEPEAAGAHYAATRDLDEGSMVAVYDLGGGTFDATVLRSLAAGVEIVGSPEGIERLGGVDFDEAILNHVDYRSGGALSELDMRDPQTMNAIARLWQDCAIAKETLSVDDETTISAFLPGRHLDVTITRSDFEGLVRAHIESTVDALSRTLSSSGVTPVDLGAVLLVGGSSRIPLVAEMVSAALGRPIVVDTHPKYAVALGAAGLAREAARAAQARSLPAPPSVPAPSNVPAPSHRPAPPGPPSGPAPGPSSHPWQPPIQQWPAPYGAPAGAPPPGVPPRRSALGGLSGKVVGIGVTAAAILILALGLALNWFGPLASADSAGDAGSPKVSVPVPNLGGTIQVGPTPGFAAVSPSGGQLYIANRGANVVSVVDTATRRVTTIPVDAGPPQFLTFAPDGKRAYVSIFDPAHTVAVIGVLDIAASKIVSTVAVPSTPSMAAVTRDGRALYVPDHDSNAISVIDTGSLSVIRRIPVAAKPNAVSFSADGSRAYIVSDESNLVSVLDAATDAEITRVPVGADPRAVAVNPRRPLLASANYAAGSVTFIDTDTNTVSATVPVGVRPLQVSWAPDGRYAYVANSGDQSVSVISADDATITATIPTGRTPTSVAVLPDGGRAYVTNLDGGTVTVLNVGG